MGQGVSPVRVADLRIADRRENEAEEELNLLKNWGLRPAFKPAKTPYPPRRASPTIAQQKQNALPGKRMDRNKNCWQKRGLVWPRLPAMKKEIHMRNRIGLGLMGLALVAGGFTANAQDVTRDWVQNANYALTATVQTGTGAVQTFTINSKAIIQYLRGLTTSNQTETTTFTTNGVGPGINVTNAPFLPNAGTPTNDFPASFVITNYFLSVGTNRFTNGMQFTNDVTFNLQQGDQVSYALDTNFVVLGTNVLGTNVVGTNTAAFSNGVVFSVITNLNFTNVSLSSLATSPQILAFLNTDAIPTNGAASNTVFTLVGVTANTTISNTPGISVPSTFISKNPKLIVKSSADNDNFTFWIRDGTTKAPIDYDVTPFFNFNRLNTVVQTRGTGEIDYVDVSVDFNNSAGTTFGTEASGKQTRAPIGRAQPGLFVKSVAVTCAGSGEAAAPPAGQPAIGRPFPVGVPMIVGGKVSITGGKLETHTAAP